MSHREHHPATDGLNQPHAPPFGARVATDAGDRDRKPVRVLFVDDNPFIVQTIKNLIDATPGLEWAGSLRSAEQLLAECQASCPDVVLLDIVMPGPSALAEMERVRDTCPDARVIVFTSYETEHQINRALDCGAWGFVSKFDSIEQLVSAIFEVAGGAMHLPRR